MKRFDLTRGGLGQTARATLEGMIQGLLRQGRNIGLLRTTPCQTHQRITLEVPHGARPTHQRGFQRHHDHDRRHDHHSGPS
jgi:hypothetical protein